mmetsp:Transcript_27815/g.60862  ORF Transcript_27815/g.60862 Transcript_27815/m.60862 type:complete len:741 (-) Transcript_27815:178-2400(-)
MAAIQNIKVAPIAARSAAPTARAAPAPRASLNARAPAMRAIKLVPSTGVAALTAHKTTQKAQKIAVRCQAAKPQRVAALTTEEVSAEGFTWSASEEFKKSALIGDFDTYKQMYEKSINEPGAFWGEIANEFYWETPFDADNVLSYNMNVKEGKVDIKWFAGGKTNIAYNALDRHVEAGNGDKVAFYWEGNEPGLDAKLTYAELKDEVCKVANWLRSKGVKKGDRVILYAPMIMELPIGMLACARIGAIHSVVFGGFSAEALGARIEGSEANVVLTCSAVMRGAKSIGLKSIVDKAIELSPHKPANVLVYDNTVAGERANFEMVEGRDVWWQDEITGQSTDCAVEWMDAEDPLFMLYTSGSTGMPKGVLHTTGGYMVQTCTSFKYTFDVQKDDVFWCTADCGWITGHSYLAYGPLLAGASQIVFEGVPTYPDAGRCWEIVEKYKCSQFYTAPTLIRSLMRAGEEIPAKFDLSTLRVCGSVGEPINPEAWRWYMENICRGQAPIVDTYWQTETGSFLLTPLPGAHAAKPGAASFPFFGIAPIILDDKGKELEGECSGLLCFKQPWPSMMRTLYGDHDRYETAYFAAYPGYYFTGDGARRDKDGYIWITGRVDDVVNVSGHRIGTAEVESALVSHPNCAEAAVVGVEHPVKGQGIYAYVTLMEGVETSDDLKKELVMAVRSAIGPFAAPDVIHWAPGLPKTRSGKIMRRILRKIASNETDSLGDTSTLAEPGVVDQLIELKGK